MSSIDVRELVSAEIVDGITRNSSRLIRNHGHDVEVAQGIIDGLALSLAEALIMNYQTRVRLQYEHDVEKTEALAAVLVEVGDSVLSGREAFKGGETAKR
jgi:hypothetical protein